MLLDPAVNLPAFDQAQLDKRFLIELDRLLQVETFATYAKQAANINVSVNYINGIAAGRYHALLKFLYSTLRHYPIFEFSYVVFSSAVIARPEPDAALPCARIRRPKTAIA